MAKRPVTIYEVADRAGVSIATVSRALRGSPLVAGSTARRVLDAADELSFRPSRMGRSLAEGRHAATGIVFPDLSGPYYAEVVLGYEEVVAELGRSVLILATHRRDNADELVTDLAARVDGMVIMGRTVGDDVVRRIADVGTPLVLLARPALDGVPTVNAENERSARRLTEHLVREHGHRDLVFLGDPDASFDVTGRHAGFTAALADADLRPRLVRCAFDVDAGRAAARAVLAEHAPDAIVCANDEVALGALEARDDVGTATAAATAVTGWDDVMAARWARLTTVRQPMRELGATAARRLDGLLDREHDGSATTEGHEELPTELVIRASCGCG